MKRYKTSSLKKQQKNPVDGIRQFTASVDQLTNFPTTTVSSVSHGGPEQHNYMLCILTSK